MKEILLVEMDTETRSLLALNLRFAGYRVFESATGVEALHRLKGGGRYDLVICRLDMPSISGLQLLNQMRASQIQIPFFLMAQPADKKEITQALRKKVQGVILKPIKPEDIVLLVQTYFEPEVHLKVA